MKRLLLWCIIWSLFSLVGCVKAIRHENLHPLIEFNRYSSSLASDQKNVISVRVGVLMPAELTEKMPLSDKDPELWRWFFLEGLKSIFKEATILERVDMSSAFQVVDVIIRPELWTWYWTGKKCSVGFVFHICDRTGSSHFSIKADGRSTTATTDTPLIGRKNEDRVMAQALDELIAKFQYLLLQRRDEIISISKM